jgi:hypothetical protein
MNLSRIVRIRAKLWDKVKDTGVREVMNSTDIPWSVKNMIIIAINDLSFSSSLAPLKLRLYFQFLISKVIKFAIQRELGESFITCTFQPRLHQLVAGVASSNAQSKSYLLRLWESGLDKYSTPPTLQQSVQKQLLTSKRLSRTLSRTYIPQIWF